MIRHARVCVSDPGGRWELGEVGVLLPNDSEKYQYKVLLEGTVTLPDFLGGGEGARVFYFFAPEVEVSETPPTPPANTCPKCGSMSWNANDAREGYCGACHWWTGVPELADLAPTRKPAEPLGPSK